ncbi:hypothetical protein [uncultured Bartonella sp.]|uniref:hypothetical protein n=1 Tax=uncultured Bartonella sp. TaxID=104108 RepID=UPI00143720EA|nr:hypothetical protein [uncultured Bartonella sp.]QHJ77043.1 MAG: hypothetical protein [Bacteriophage sp.]
MARANANGKFYICTTPQPSDLTKEQFEALEWTKIEEVGKLPESGSSTNIIKYDTIDTTVTQKAKGVTDAGGGSLEVAYTPDAPGQQALRKIAGNNYMYATKREVNDAPDENHTNSVFYNRGLITGPVRSGGGVEDFITETYTIANNQLEIVVPPQLKTNAPQQTAENE